ncbi:30S ribosomal protein S6 [Roseivirga ehrenbergii]|uniref:Small ribosomal subunit protein bS6 n=1 Tax=Roseivirga ehrenbergii (strain DSM 102268 / JCM 13514 / KCTC 12282 / NCIMB 14502 / KMM 6017) TaxID=279360 RepID=A0A150WXY0_ROSEK|nr:30S ribosomal protein S6 [Roseivirga ehrenbergii]KYG71337.1 30S ribosomal protein S6 [Roseivirga ehrenbergii]
MNMNNYETVFILNPVLSDDQMKDAVGSFETLLKNNGAEIINVEKWGLKKLAYPIQHKSTGFYNLIEFKADPSLIKTLEVEFKRDEKVMRFLTTALNKHAIEYNEKRRKGAFNKSKKEEAAA